MNPARHRKLVRNTIGVVVIFLSTLTAFGQASRGKSDRPPAPKRSNQKRKAARETNAGAVNSSERLAKGQELQAQQSQAKEDRSPKVEESEHNDVSPPLRSIPPAARTRGHHVHDIEILPRIFNRGATDPVIQRSAPTALAPVTTTNFDGIGQGFTGPAGTFSVSSAPPDTNGDVGPNHYVQVVNSDLAIFNKSGTAIYGPVPTNTLWSGFGGLCQTDNDGDGVVVYDPIANRWVVSQFAVSGTTTGYLQCVAVSTGPDPTGTWNRYAFNYGNQFPDYPKMGVWPDAYYTTFNMFNSAGTAFLGGRACAYDRAKMLAGQPATQVCFNPTDAGSVAGGLLPADLDGSLLPPPGAPNYIIALGNNANQLAVYKFHVDFITPANSTLTGPADLAVASFSEACAGGTCIPQTGTTQKLDSLADRLMFRLAYRNFNDHEALVVNHSVTAGTGTGLRWYELRPDASRNLSIFQQGTYAPDSNFRWMGSIAMDKNGNMGLGFSVSGSALRPGIHYTGRLASSPAGVMDQGEGTVIDGAGSQTGSSLSRWGDYSAMTVDPSDDCTFWYTTEYIPANGAFNWRTRIGSFKFPGCGSTTNDFSISANPTSISVAPGGSGTSTISTALTTGSSQTVTLSASGLPAGATASFSPASVTTGSSSTLTLTAGAGTPAGTYPVTVTGTGASATHTTSVSFTVGSAVNDFSISASPNTLSIAQSGSGTSTISTAVTAGVAQTVTLSVAGVPSGASASFNPASVSAGGSSTLTVNAGTAAAGTYSLTVTGTGPSATHSTSVSLTVTATGGSSIVNGGFETGTLSGWTSAGTTAVVNTGAHSGTFASRVGGTAATNGDSSIVQTFTSPAAGGSLTFWYKVQCPDTVTYDWATATLKDNTTNTTATVLPKVCTNNGTWVQSNAATIVGSHSYTLTLISHDDNIAGDPSFTLFDDVVIGAAPSGGITNGGFETGSFSGWTTLGTASIIASGAHGGTFAARIGGTSATNGDSNTAQTFVVPSGKTQLAFWYKLQCPDTVTYDWATVTLKDNTTNTTTTVLPKTCTNNAAWVQRTAVVTAGHSYTLTLISHDDNYAADPTFAIYDDVVLN